ncbi:MAG TPA: LpxI family protein [Nitrospirae bacterium]|nr:hypothetical protein BMS3Abin09_01030 [bacterium BMS3Abin09]HDZ83585.1 LpxI family protein [Nitrospirota bacterium]
MPVKSPNHSEPSKKLGLIAGMGDLPKAVASEAKRMGYKVTAIALQPPADESLKPIADEFHKISLGRFGGLIALLKKLAITDVVLAGKVPKDLLYKSKNHIIPDMKAVKVLLSLRNRADDTIMKAVVREIEGLGIKIHNTTDFTKDLLVPEGILTRKKPTKKELQDIEFGWNIAKKIGQLDIGQTVVVKDMAVMAVEAIEGTDEAIKRGGDLSKKDAVVIKVSKPNQDMRFDVPVAGIDTLHIMKKTGARVLVLEAGRCIIVDIKNFVNKANEYGIVVVGTSNNNLAMEQSNN